MRFQFAEAGRRWPLSLILALGLVGLTALVLSVAGLVFGRAVGGYLDQIDQAELRAMAAAAERELALNPARSPAEAQVRLESLLPGRVRFISVSELEPGALIIESGPFGSAIRYEFWSRPKARPRTVYLALRQGGQLLGYLSIETRGVRADVRRGLLVVGVWAGVAGLLGALWLGSWVARPLRRLSGAAAALGRGQWDQPIPADGPREVADLADRLRQMAAELRQTFARLEDERRRLREFLADAGHELKTPLTSLRAFNELLLSGAQDDPAVRAEFLERSREQIERLNWLSQGLLDLSRLEAVDAGLERERVNLADLTRRQVEAMRPLAERKGVELVVAVPPLAQFEALVDPRRWQQVLDNLVSNALRFTPTGGRVEIGLARQADLRPDEGSIGNPSRLALTVRDTGPGFRPEALPRIFDRFYRDPDQPGEGGGAGLGLAIVRRIAELHGGRVEAKNAADGGAVVCVELPGAPPGETQGDGRR